MKKIFCCLPHSGNHYVNDLVKLRLFQFLELNNSIIWVTNNKTGGALGAITLLVSLGGAHMLQLYNAGNSNDLSLKFKLVL